MSLRVAKMQARDLGFPRVSGDEPVAKRDKRRKPKFSPRERG